MRSCELTEKIWSIEYFEIEFDIKRCEGDLENWYRKIINRFPEKYKSCSVKHGRNYIAFNCYSSSCCEEVTINFGDLAGNFRKLTPEESKYLACQGFFITLKIRL